MPKTTTPNRAPEPSDIEEFLGGTGDLRQAADELAGTRVTTIVAMAALQDLLTPRQLERLGRRSATALVVRVPGPEWGDPVERALNSLASFGWICNRHGGSKQDKSTVGNEKVSDQLTCGLNVAGVSHDPGRYLPGALVTGADITVEIGTFEPGVTNLMLVVGLWNLFSLITAGAALGVAAERRQTEKAPSLAVDRPAVLNLNGMALDVTVERISSARCRIRLDAVLPMRRAGDGSVGTLSALPQANLPLLSHARTIPVRLAGVTAAGEESVCDLVFETLTPGSYFALADLMYGDADAMVRFQQRRRAHKDIVSGTLQFIRWGITGPIRAFACLMTPAAAPEVEEPAGRPRSAERQRASDPGRPTDSKPTRTAEGHAAGAPTSDASPSWLQLMVEPESTAGGTERGRRAADLTDADLLPTRAG